MQTRFRQSGFTLIELLVVLAIIAILAVAAGSYLTMPRQKPAVQNLLSETEGLLADAHKYSGATLGNVIVEGDRTWSPVTAPDPGCTLSFRAVSSLTNVRTLTYAGFGDHDYAGFDTTATAAGVATAVGSETLAAALAATPSLAAELGTALSTNLMPGSKSGVQINAYNKQFLTPFCIPIVGLRAGAPYAGAPAGYVVVNGNKIYKFYKAGPGAQNPWRRL